MSEREDVSGSSFGDTTWYAENGTVYNTGDDLTTIVCFYNRDTGIYMSLPHDIAEKVAEMLNYR
jgi:hypothetical protein